MTAPRDVVWVRLPTAAAAEAELALSVAGYGVAAQAIREALARPDGDVWEGWEDYQGNVCKVRGSTRDTPCRS